MRYIIILLFISNLLFAYEFTLFNDQSFNDNITSVATTDSFRAYTYESYRFAVLTNKDEIRFFVLSTDFSRVIGYQGTTTLGIIFNKELTVERLEIVRSQETAGYIRTLNRMGFPQRFDGFNKGDAVEIITGATMTSDAMIESVNETIEKFKPIVEKYLKGL